MSPEPTAGRGTVPLGPDAKVDLLLPPDFYDLLHPADPVQARTELDVLFRRMLPTASAEQIAAAVDGMMRWRELLTSAHVLVHGFVGVPAGEHTPVPVHWHVLVAALEVPTPDELDVGTLFARVLGQRWDETRTYVEPFESRMGWGVGVLGSFTPQLPEGIGPLVAGLGGHAVAGGPAHAEVGEVGVAATITGAHGSSVALGVLGVCIDPDQVLELGGLVTAIGAGSVLDTGLAAEPAP